MSVNVVRMMFEEMVIPKDAGQIERFYAPSFVMTSNGVGQGYEDFAQSHRTTYATEIVYAVEYDEDAWVEQVDDAGTGKVAGRVWITTSRPGEKPTRIEVVLIAALEDGRITRVWETTYPNWADLAAFERYGC